MANSDLKTRNRHLRVLCVDDDSSICESMQVILRIRGYEAYGVSSGLFALEQLREADFDLVITDLTMPGMDGIELIRRIRKMKPDQKIIVVTAFPSPRTQGQAFKLGTLSYVAKPFSGSRLLEVVDGVLNEDGEEGLIGSVHLSCEELIQLYSFGQKSAVIEIRSNGHVGRIYLENGNPIHAATDNLEGEEAFFEILTWRNGSFTVVDHFGEINRSINRCADSLLLEGARRRDECNYCGSACIVDRE